MHVLVESEASANMSGPGPCQVLLFQMVALEKTLKAVFHSYVLAFSLYC